MNIGVLGTGIVAKTVAGKLGALGHDVKMGTRDVRSTLARDDKDMAGGPPVRVFLEGQKNVSLVTFAEAAKHGEIIFNALSGRGVTEAVAMAGKDNLASKIIVDITNPLDFSKGFPPSLFVSNTDSLGEQIQRELPNSKVVKTLNTVNAFLMVDPAQLAGADHTMFVCGDDASAKTEVTRILKEWFGWKDVVDLGGIANSRGLEMWLPLWVRLYGALGHANFNLKLVR